LLLRFLRRQTGDHLVVWLPLRVLSGLIVGFMILLSMRLDGSSYGRLLLKFFLLLLLLLLSRRSCIVRLLNLGRVRLLVNRYHHVVASATSGCGLILRRKRIIVVDYSFRGRLRGSEGGVRNAV
jgi:hypothetical protein